MVHINKNSIYMLFRIAKLGVLDQKKFKLKIFLRHRSKYFFSEIEKMLFCVFCPLIIELIKIKPYFVINFLFSELFCRTLWKFKVNFQF